MKNKINFIIYFLISVVVVLFIIGSILDIRYESKILESQISLLEKSIKNEYKKRLRESVDSTINYIDKLYFHNKEKKHTYEELEHDVRQYLYENIHDSTRYTWINKVVNYEGGDNYAIRLIHPNLKHTEGVYLSTKTNDIKGNFPYLEELEGIKKDGEIFFTYYFKQLNSEKITEKLSFAKLYRELNWIVVTGIPINTLNKMVIDEKNRYEEQYNKLFYLKLIAEVVFLLTLIFTILWLKNKIYELIKENLKEKDQTILEQAKMATLGGMLSNIIHQFKQPLSVISTVSSVLKFEKEQKTLDDKKIENYADSILDSVEYMSETMETFRNYTKADKEYKDISIQSEIKKAKIITYGVLNDKTISLRDNVDYENEIKLKLVSGELLQVLVNLINNAKDILLQKGIQKPWIELNLIDEEDKLIISVEDNGGGVPEDIIDEIFDPYVTTKETQGGSGLGLHMSKNIVTQSMGGVLSVSNSENGALFTIELKKNEKETK